MNAVLIGEAWGEAEALYGRPFVGPSGQELWRVLSQAGWPCPALPYNYVSPFTMLTRWEASPVILLNTFNAHPPSNLIESFYDKAGDRSLPSRRFSTTTTWVRPEMAPHVHELHAQLSSIRPNLIVPLGATACWALGLGTAVTKLRGFVHQTRWGKALPTYHPAAVLGKWGLRPSLLLDLVKAKREAEFPEIRTTSRQIWTEPTIPDLWAWWEQHGSRSPLLSIDIETLKQRQISEFGVAASPTQALHIPFVWKEGREYKSWWPDVATEAEAWRFVKHVCESDTPKILQNFQYDSYWLAKEMGIVIKNIRHDTMLLSHCFQPELEKSLSFLGSVWLDEKSWKQIRHESGKDFE